MLFRVPIVARREWTMSPLAVAVDELRAKCAALRRTLSVRQGVDAKRLQLQLQVGRIEASIKANVSVQGIVQTTVNAGPLVYANAFTTDAQKRKYGEAAIRQLAAAFRWKISQKPTKE